MTANPNLHKVGFQEFPFGLQDSADLFITGACMRLALNVY
jgi:hypothetical protein